MKYVLIGFKNSGKTQFGEYLAEKLELPFVDIDRKIEEKHFTNTREALCYFSIFNKYGESYFRSLEKSCIFEIEDFDGVVSTGGGSLLDIENTEHLQKIGTLIYLKASKECLRSRMQAARIPGFLDSKDLMHSFDEAFEKRTKIYEKFSQIEIDIDDKMHPEIFQDLEKEIFKEAIVG